MKINELIRLLKENGCYFVREGKRHEIWVSPLTGLEFPVPRHGSQELPTGTKNGILKDAGIKK